MNIKKEVLEEISVTVGKYKPETGGVLGIKENIVCSFYFDENSTYVSNEYCPNIDAINLKLEEWAKDGIAFAGILHSHPNGYTELSKADKECIFYILKTIHCLRQLYFPIITISNNDFLMTVYCATQSQDKIFIKKTDYNVL